MSGLQKMSKMLKITKKNDFIIFKNHQKKLRDNFGHFDLTDMDESLRSTLWMLYYDLIKEIPQEYYKNIKTHYNIDIESLPRYENYDDIFEAYNESLFDIIENFQIGKDYEPGWNRVHFNIPHKIQNELYGIYHDYILQFRSNKYAYNLFKTKYLIKSHLYILK